MIGLIGTALAVTVGIAATGMLLAPVERSGESLISDAEARAGLEQVSDYGINLIAYATVRRTDGTYRRMLITPESLDEMTDGADLPEGTRILMETYYNPGQVGTVFHKQKVGGGWNYGSFSAARPDLATSPRASCLACHARASDTDFTFTLPSVMTAAESGIASDFTCDRGGRAPCGPHVYRNGAGR
ncbi:MAG: cytochrome P460 family protein [Pseudomonadota bacterium]